MGKDKIVELYERLYEGKKLETPLEIVNLMVELGATPIGSNELEASYIVCCKKLVYGPTLFQNIEAGKLKGEVRRIKANNLSFLYPYMKQFIFENKFGQIFIYLVKAELSLCTCRNQMQEWTYQLMPTDSINKIDSIIGVGSFTMEEREIIKIFSESKIK